MDIIHLRLRNNDTNSVITFTLEETPPIVYVLELTDYAVTYIQNYQKHTAASDSKIFKEIVARLEDYKQNNILDYHSIEVDGRMVNRVPVVYLSRTFTTLSEVKTPRFRKDELLSFVSKDNVTYYIAIEKDGQMRAYYSRSEGNVNYCTDLNYLSQIIKQVKFEDFKIINKELIFKPKQAPTPNTQSAASNASNNTVTSPIVVTQTVSPSPTTTVPTPANKAPVETTKTPEAPTKTKTSVITPDSSEITKRVPTETKTLPQEDKSLDISIQNFVISLIADSTTDSKDSHAKRIKIINKKDAAAVKDLFIETLKKSLHEVANNPDTGPKFKQILNGTEKEKAEFVSKALVEIYKNDMFSNNVKFNYLGKTGDTFKSLVEWVHAVVCKLLGNDTAMKSWQENYTQMEVIKLKEIKPIIESELTRKTFTNVFNEIAKSQGTIAR